MAQHTGIILCSAVLLSALLPLSCNSFPVQKGKNINVRDTDHLNTEPSNIYDLYEFLIGACETLQREEKVLYETYKVTRFGTANITIPTFPMEGLPSVGDLPPLIRFNMTEEELLSVHRQNLISFKGAVQQVYNDEQISSDPTNFLQDLQNTMDVTENALARLDVVMYELDLNLPTPSVPVLFEPQPNESIRNTRDLYVLQEMHLYLPIPLADFVRFQRKHVITPSPPTAPPSQDVYNEYELLIEETRAMYTYTNNVVHAYQMDRNGGFTCGDVDLPGMPDRLGLESERFKMTEEVLLTTHRSNLNIYQDALEQVLVDEQRSTSPTDFSSNFEQIQDMKTRTLARQESVMFLLNIPLEEQPPSSVVLDPENNEAIRNQRDCFILQEIGQYQEMCLEDFPRLQAKHKQP